MRLAHASGLLGLLALATGVIATGCGSSGGVASGGACFMATDCAEGLICIGVTMTTAGMCSNNLGKVQPSSDGSFPDGGEIPEDGIPAADGTAPPPKDSSTPPADTGAPADTGGPTDTGAPPKDAGSAG